jgi:hypothetical protein
LGVNVSGRPPSRQTAGENVHVVVAVQAKHPNYARGVWHRAVIVRDDGRAISDAALADRLREELGRRDPGRVRGCGIGQLDGIVEMDRIGNVTRGVRFRAGRKDESGCAVRLAARVDDAQLRVVEMRSEPIEFDERFAHAGLASSTA